MNYCFTLLWYSSLSSVTSPLGGGRGGRKAVLVEVVLEVAAVEVVVALGVGAGVWAEVVFVGLIYTGFWGGMLLL